MRWTITDIAKSRSIHEYSYSPLKLSWNFTSEKGIGVKKVKSWEKSIFRGRVEGRAAPNLSTPQLGGSNLDFSLTFYHFSLRVFAWIKPRFVIKMQNFMLNRVQLSVFDECQPFRRYLKKSDQKTVFFGDSRRFFVSTHEFWLFEFYSLKYHFIAWSLNCFSVDGQSWGQFFFFFWKHTKARFWRWKIHFWFSRVVDQRFVFSMFGLVPGVVRCRWKSNLSSQSGWQGTHRDTTTLVVVCSSLDSIFDFQQISTFGPLMGHNIPSVECIEDSKIEKLKSRVGGSNSVIFFMFQPV